MEDLEEIKEVGGRRYSKVSHLYSDVITALYILDTKTGDTGYRPLRSDPTLHHLLSTVQSYLGLSSTVSSRAPRSWLPWSQSLT